MKDEVEAFRCRLCGHLVTPCRWKGGECAGCGSVSCTMLPSESELNEYYHKFNETYDGGHRGGGNLGRYADRYMQILKRYVPNGHIVDVGTSRSPFPNIAVKAGFSVKVIDYVEPKGLHPSVVFDHGSLNDESILQAHGGCYDAVCAWAVLEHVPNPQLACRLLSGMCKPGGFIILSTPEIGTALTSNSIGRSSWFCPPMHLHLASAHAIRAIFSKHNCRLVSCGRLELNCWRWLARYGIGAAEATVGAFVKKLDLRCWRKLRDSRVQKFMGISYYIIQKQR